MAGGHTPGSLARPAHKTGAPRAPQGPRRMHIMFHMCPLLFAVCVCVYGCVEYFVCIRNSEGLRVVLAWLCARRALVGGAPSCCSPRWMSSRVSSALVESKLAALVADAPLLDASTAALLSGDELPALAAVCSALGVPLAHSTNPPDSQSLPMRLITAGVDAERTLWRTFADAALHELLTRELIDALVNHISRALDRCERAGVAQPTILEVGAGNGMLTYHLARRLGSRARVVAVDDGSSRIATQVEVQVLDQATALARFAPQIVLACWMPSGCDWTAGFRACASVREYLLLGHPSACGDERASMSKRGWPPRPSLALALALGLALGWRVWPCTVAGRAQAAPLVTSGGRRGAGSPSGATTTGSARTASPRTRQRAGCAPGSATSRSRCSAGSTARRRAASPWPSRSHSSRRSCRRARHGRQHVESAADG